MYKAEQTRRISIYGNLLSVRQARKIFLSTSRVIITAFHKSKSRLREVGRFTQGHQAFKWQGQDLTADLSVTRATSGLSGCLAKS